MTDLALILAIYIIWNFLFAPFFAGWRAGGKRSASRVREDRFHAGNNSPVPDEGEFVEFEEVR